MKKAALARAEAFTASKFVSKESEIVSSESCEEQETEVINSNVCDTKERDDTPSRNTHTKKGEIANKGDTPTYTTPKREEANLHALKIEDKKKMRKSQLVHPIGKPQSRTKKLGHQASSPLPPLTMLIIG